MPSEHEPILQHHGAKHYWYGENDDFLLTMSDETFERYVWGFLRVEGIRQPTSEQYTAATAYCMRMKYWEQCWLNYDYHIHIHWKAVPLRLPAAPDGVLEQWIEHLKHCSPAHPEPAQAYP